MFVACTQCETIISKIQMFSSLLFMCGFENEMVVKYDQTEIILKIKFTSNNHKNIFFKVLKFVAYGRPVYYGYGTRREPPTMGK
jgi:hypothetical protein